MKKSFNENSLAEYKQLIGGLIKEHCLTGLEIARQFAAAEKCLSKKDFRALHKHFGFSYPTARKLVKVGNSQRISEHEDQLRQLGLDAWSTLHELVKLDDAAFGRFSTEFLSPKAPQPFTRSDVVRFKSGTRATKPNREVLAVIEIDPDQIKFEGILEVERKIGALADELSKYPGVKLIQKWWSDRLVAKATIEEQQPVEAARVQLRGVEFSRPVANAQWADATPLVLEPRPVQYLS